MWQILLHMGKDVSFLPPNNMVILDQMGKELRRASFPLKCKAILPHMGKELCLLPRSASFPSFSPKCNTILPQKFSPLEMILPASKYKTPTNPSLQILFISLFFMLFLFVYIFIFFLISFEFSFPPFFFFPKLGILPQSGKIIPQRLGWITEE